MFPLTGTWGLTQLPWRRSGACKKLTSRPMIQRISSFNSCISNFYPPFRYDWEQFLKEDNILKNWYNSKTNRDSASLREACVAGRRTQTYFRNQYRSHDRILPLWFQIIFWWLMLSSAMSTYLFFRIFCTQKFLSVNVNILGVIRWHKATTYAQSDDWM